MNTRKLACISLITLLFLLALGGAMIYLSRSYNQAPLPVEVKEGEAESANALTSRGTASFTSKTASRSPNPHPEGETAEQDVPTPPDQSDVSDDQPALPASITGHVYDVDGNGISGASVRLRVGTPQTAAPPGEAVYLMDRDIAWHLLMSSTAHEEIGNYTAKTNRDGRYRIAAIRHFGDALLSASAPGYAPVHSGEYMELEGANALVSVSEGADYKKMDFTLFAEAARLRGRVLNPARQGVADARVVVAKQSCRHGTQEAYGAVSAANGAFEIALPCDDECVVVAYKTGFAPAYRAEVMPGAGEIELLLGIGGAIVGTVRDANGDPASGVKIVVTPRDLEKDVNPWNAPNPVKATSREDGSYAVRDLSEEFLYSVQIPYPPEEPKPLAGSAPTLSEFIQYKEVTTSRSNYHSRFYLWGENPRVMAEARNVAVNAGEETRVDLTIQDTSGQCAVIHGRITDANTGLPATPFYVLAREHDADNNGTTLAEAVTQEDGSYQLLCYGLAEATPLTVCLEYTAPSNEAAAVLGDIILSPGEEVEMNYSMDALVTAPVRIVSTSGTPIQGMDVSNVVSGEDGRLTIYGLAPYKTHQLQAMWDEPVLNTHMVAGVSAPFSGKPGETVPEVVITCPLTGALIGYLVLPDGMTENTTGEIVPCRAFCSEADYHSLGAFLSPDGTVRVPMVPPGVCAIKFFLLPEDENDEGIYSAVLEDVVIVSGQETDVGIIAPVYESPEQQDSRF